MVVISVFILIMSSQRCRGISVSQPKSRSGKQAIFRVNTHQVSEQVLAVHNSLLSGGLEFDGEHTRDRHTAAVMYPAWTPLPQCSFWWQPETGTSSHDCRKWSWHGSVHLPSLAKAHMWTSTTQDQSMEALPQPPRVLRDA